MLRIKPLSLKQANKFVDEKHRHHKGTWVYKFAIGAYDDLDTLRGVVIVGLPVSRHLDDGVSAEVTRLCSDGYPNVCSKLYSAAWKTARNMGYVRLYTYILESESGTTLKASGWRFDAHVIGRPWNHKKRKRKDEHPLCDKQRWIIYTQEGRVRNKPQELSPKEKMSAGAKSTHYKRVKCTEASIRMAIRRLKQSNKRISKAAVARIVGVSREHISRRYSHFFP